MIVEPFSPRSTRTEIGRCVPQAAIAALTITSDAGRPVFAVKLRGPSAVSITMLVSSSASRGRETRATFPVSHRGPSTSSSWTNGAKSGCETVSVSLPGSASRMMKLAVPSGLAGPPARSRPDANGARRPPAIPAVRWPRWHGLAWREFHSQQVAQIAVPAYIDEQRTAPGAPHLHLRIAHQVQGKDRPAPIGVPVAEIKDGAAHVVHQPEVTRRGQAVKESALVVVPSPIQLKRELPT